MYFADGKINDLAIPLCKTLKNNQNLNVSNTELKRPNARSFLEHFLETSIYHIKTESMKLAHKFARCLGSTDLKSMKPLRSMHRSHEYSLLTNQGLNDPACWSGNASLFGCDIGIKPLFINMPASLE